MKRNVFLILLTATAIFAASNTGLAQALNVKVTNMSVLGTSSLHDWESQITKAEWKGQFVTANNALTEVKNIEVKIPVQAIKSTKGKMMDSKTYEAFKSDKNPNIVFTLASTTINQASGTVSGKGNLTMAGVTRPFEVEGKYKVLADGSVQLTVSRTLKMTDFKMEPPTAMMGSIKVGDEVTVKFDVTIQTKQI